MRFDSCRSTGSATAPILADCTVGEIPGAVYGSIPEAYAAREPIYFEGLVSFEDFLTAGNQAENNLNMAPPASSHDQFVWPVTSRFSFVSAVSLAILAALILCLQAEASDSKDSNSFTDKQNVRIAHNAQTTAASTNETSGRVISFVCGRPNTLQALAPMDLPEKQVRYLPQGASPIAEMKFMPARKLAAKNAGAQMKLDKTSTDRIYNRLLKLSLADPAVYETEAPSLITYFSILTGGQDQKRVQELEKILEKKLNK